VRGGGAAASRAARISWRHLGIIWARLLLLLAGVLTR